jgi:hypothetical protein
MNKLLIAVTIATLFSATASANSGLADRISDARSYPNKTVNVDSSKNLVMKHKKLHLKMDKAGVDNNQEHLMNEKCSKHPKIQKS